MSEHKFQRVVQILRDEIRFLVDFPDKAEGGMETAPDRVKELMEAIERLEKEGQNG